jgi:hypothetical protein
MRSAALPSVQQTCDAHPGKGSNPNPRPKRGAHQQTAMISAVGIHHAIRLVRVLPSQSLELCLGSGSQQGSTPCWIGGHGTEP